MIKVNQIDVWGFKHAVRGMRNPLNSWDKSDSTYDNFVTSIGPNDLDLMKRLIAAGPEHRKFLRQIFVSMDITAPLYWWKEFDTYKVGTAANSCSTMHKIAAKEFTLDDFSYEHLLTDRDISVDETLDRFEPSEETAYPTWPIDVLYDTIAALEWARLKYLETMDKKYWWQMIQLLPSSYNQMRTVTMNYENVYSMIRQRTDHKLDEWNEFVDILKYLPGVKDMFVFETEGQND